MDKEIREVRTIISDDPVYASDEIILDGVQTSFQVQYFPLIQESVIITPILDPAPSSISEKTGVFRFAAAPDAQTIKVEYNHVSLLNESICTFLHLQGNDWDVRLAAADALDSIATQQALIQKKIKLLDLQTDGPALAQALRAHAKALRDRVLADEPGFEIIEQINDKFGYREKVVKDWMRQGID